MILDAEAAALRLAPSLVPAGRISAASIQTTRPKYLIFGHDERRPLCVVQFGPESALTQVHAVLSRLEPVLPGIVPAALACARWSGDSWVQIQSGLEGTPWFEVQRNSRSVEHWLGLEDAALLALERLQSAISGIPEWTKPVFTSSELRAQFEIVTRQGVVVSTPARQRIEAAIIELQGLPPMNSQAQHGDYSLNNVLVGENGAVRIIDFDEFGLTYMPLQDEIGLGLSMAALAPTHFKEVSVPAYLNRSTARAAERLRLSRPQVAGLTLYHLLWRISQSQDHTRRARAAGWLSAVLEQLTRDATFGMSPA